MAKKSPKELGTENIGKLLMRYAVPAVIAMTASSLYNIVDRIFIGHIQPADTVGALALTGVGLFTPILMLITAFAMMVGSGGAPRAAISMGQGDNDTAEKILGNCAAGLTIVALVRTAVLLLFGRQALMMFGASEETIGYAWDYMSIYAIGTIAVQFSKLQA